MQIFKEKNGTYAYRVEIGKNPKTGRRMQKRRGGFRRERDAIAEAQRIENEVRQHRYVNDSPVTFVEFAEEWLQMYADSNVKSNSVRIRRNQIHILCTYLECVPMQQITAKKYETSLLKIGRAYSRNTLEGVHGAARMIFKRARRYGIIRDDPTEFFTLPREKEEIRSMEDEVPAYLEKEELSSFLLAAKEYGMDGDYAFFTVLAYTGIRIGEALALTWDDVSYKDKTIRINKTLYNPTNNMHKYELSTPKTKRSNRIIPVDDHTLSVLSVQQMELNTLRMHYGTDYHVPTCCDRGFVFPSVSSPGYPKSPRLIQMRIDRIVKKMQTPPPMRVHPHLFRHTHVSLLAEAGVSLEQIQDRLGHADDETTREIYLHITKHMKKDAVEKFANLMKTADT